MIAKYLCSGGQQVLGSLHFAFCFLFPSPLTTINLIRMTITNNFHVFFKNIVLPLSVFLLPVADLNHSFCFPTTNAIAHDSDAYSLLKFFCGRCLSWRKRKSDYCALSLYGPIEEVNWSVLAVHVEHTRCHVIPAFSHQSESASSPWAHCCWEWQYKSLRNFTLVLVKLYTLFLRFLKF